jgi:hypothetical protein
MATSVFFNNFQSSQEQFLIEDLVIESIKIYGHDVYYIPRVRVAFDKIYGEDTLSEFRDSYFIEMFIKNVDGFDGDGDFISKFGLEIRDRVTFTIARRTFNNEIGLNNNAVRPFEGDLIFFPLNKKIFEIKFVEHEAIFYQMGALQTYDLVCELFEYSSERFSTGIDFIDTLFTDNYLTGKNYSEVISDYSFITEDTNPYQIITEDGYRIIQEDSSNTTLGDSTELQTEADAFIDFSEMDPFAEGTY